MVVCLKWPAHESFVFIYLSCLTRALCLEGSATYCLETCRNYSLSFTFRNQLLGEHVQLPFSLRASLVNNSSLLTWICLQGLQTVVAVEDLLSLCDKVQRFINIGWTLFCSEALIASICFINTDIAVCFVLKWQRLAWLEI